MQAERYYAPDGMNRANASIPNMCLVMATGLAYPTLTLGLGTVHPNCHVSVNSKLQNYDSTAAWADKTWTLYVCCRR